MLRLKIGQNFLLTEYHRDLQPILDKVIPYMMGCFKGAGKVATIPENCDEAAVVKALREIRVNELYILQSIDYLQLNTRLERKDMLTQTSYALRKIIMRFKELEPTLSIKVINVNAYFKTGGYLISRDLYNILLHEPDSILSALPRLEMHKAMTKRLASIPEEIKVIDNDLKKLSKEKQVCDRTVSLKAIEYLKLIKDAKMVGNNLELELNSLPIYPSEPLGMIFSYEEMKRNKYLYKAAKHIYQGGHFQMPETKIKIGTNFYPEFMETLDHRWDSMFQNHNWSTIGYPHFGQNHFCAGEFNDVIAHAKEYGLDYYFIALKQYLTTANMKDTAGYRVWWYPIYNDAGELIYCAGYDIAIEEFVKKIDRNIYAEVMALPTWEEKITYLHQKRLSFNEGSILEWGCRNLSYYHSHKDDSFLQLCKETEPEVYAEIMKGREN